MACFHRNFAPEARLEARIDEDWGVVKTLVAFYLPPRAAAMASAAATDSKLR
jgi:hypothetical protein